MRLEKEPMSLDTPILAEALFHSNLEEIKHKKGKPNWSHQFVGTDHVRASPICKTPGTETDYHVHDYDVHDYDE